MRGNGNIQFERGEKGESGERKRGKKLNLEKRIGERGRGERASE